MKKITLICALLLLLLFSSCMVPSNSSRQPPQGTGTPTASQIATTTKEKPTNITIAAGQSESEWYSLGNEISFQIAENLEDVTTSVKSTSGVMENLQLLASNKVEIVIGYDYHVIMANQGSLMHAFPDAPSEKFSIKCGVEITRPAFPDYSLPFRIVLPLREQPILIFTTSSTGINTLNDLKGKTISTGEAGSTTEELAEYILKGLELDQHISQISLSVNESMAALKDGEIGAIFFSGSVSDIAAFLTKPEAALYIIPINDTDAKKVMQASPAIFHKTSIPAGTFNSIETGTETLAVTLTLITTEDIPAEKIHQIAAVLYEEYMSISISGTETESYLHEGTKEYLHASGIIQQ